MHLLGNNSERLEILLWCCLGAFDHFAAKISEEGGAEDTLDVISPQIVKLCHASPDYAEGAIYSMLRYYRKSLKK